MRLSNIIEAPPRPKVQFLRSINVPTHASLYFRIQILRTTLSQTLISMHTLIAHHPALINFFRRAKLERVQYSVFVIAMPNLLRITLHDS